MQLKFKQIVLIVIGIIAIVVCAGFCNGLLATNQSGEYQVKQAFYFGTMSARMVPGTYFRNFGKITVFPVARTFHFTSDKDTQEDVTEDNSIEVRFQDGSLCKVSGTVRVNLPNTERQLVDLVTKYGYKDYIDLERNLIMKVVRNAIRSSSNLMTAQESYSERRLDYLNWTWDQIQNGLYQVDDVQKEITDPLTGTKSVKVVKTIKRDPKSGQPMRQPDEPIEGTGITLSNFEVKQFKYDPRVEEQIAEQQKARMAIATAKAMYDKAEQDARTAEAEGKKLVMNAKYEKEQEKVRATVTATQAKEVAEIEAQQKVAVAELAKKEAEVKASQLVSVAELEKKQAEVQAAQKVAVADLDKQAANAEKAAKIARGEGEAQAKSLIMQADGQLALKLDAYVQAQKAWADAYSRRNVPNMIVGGGMQGENGDKGALSFQDALGLKLMSDLNLNLAMKPQSKSEQPAPQQTTQASH